jgi:hypothetical protein
MWYWILYNRTITSQTMNRASAPIAPPSRTYYLQIDRLLVHLQSSSITASKWISKLAWMRPPGASPMLLDHGIPLHLQTCTMAASKCISKLAQLWPPSASPMLLDHSLHLQPHTRSIPASKCNSKLGWSWPPHASPNLLDLGVGEYTWAHSIIIVRRILQLGKIECVFRIMRWSLYTQGSSKSILPIAESNTGIPVSQNVYI